MVFLFNFILIHDYCEQCPLNLDGFPNAATLLSFSCEFDTNSDDAVLLLCRVVGVIDFKILLIVYLIIIVLSLCSLHSTTKNHGKC